MSVIIRLQNLPWSANALDIRGFFRGLAIPDGGVHIVGGENGDAFIAFSTDEDARQAMMQDRGKINEVQIRLLLSSRAEMQKVIETARQQSLAMQLQLTGSGPKPMIPQNNHQQSMPTPQPPVITTNSLHTILSNQSLQANNFNPIQAYTSVSQQQQKGSYIGSADVSRTSRETSRDRRRSDSKERRRSRSNDRGSNRRRRDRSRTRSRDRKLRRGSRRSRSRDRSHERSRDRSRDRSNRDRNGNRGSRKNSRDVDSGFFNQDRSVDRKKSPEKELPKAQPPLNVWNVLPTNAYTTTSFAANYAAQALQSAAAAGVVDSEMNSHLSSANQNAAKLGFNSPIDNADKSSGVKPVQDVSALSFLKVNQLENRPTFAFQNPYTQASTSQTSNTQNDSSQSSTMKDQNNYRFQQSNQYNKDGGSNNQESWPDAFGRNIPKGDAGNKRFEFQRKNDRKDIEEENSCVKISNMCPSTSYSDIRRFFSGLYIPNNGIKMINDSHGLRVGTAYIRFVRALNVPKALVRDGTLFKNKKIALEAVSDAEFADAVDSFKPTRGQRFSHNDNNSRSSHDHPRYTDNKREDRDSYRDDRSRSRGTDKPFSILYVKDIPPYSTQQDVMKMFSSYTIMDILLTHRPENRREIIAYVKFHRVEDAQAAFEEKANHRINQRPVRISIATEEEYEDVKERVRLDTEKQLKEQKELEEIENRKRAEAEAQAKENDETPNQGQQDQDDRDDCEEEEEKQEEDEQEEETVALDADDRNQDSPQYPIDEPNAGYDQCEENMDDFNDQGNNFSPHQQGMNPSNPFSGIPSLLDMPASLDGNEPEKNSDPRLRQCRPSRFDNPNSNEQINPLSTCFILIKNCEYKTPIQTVGEYFMSHNLMPNHVELLRNHRNQPCGEFIVELRSPQDAERALSLNNNRLITRALRISLISPQQIADRLNKPFMNFFPSGGNQQHPNNMNMMMMQHQGPRQNFNNMGGGGGGNYHNNRNGNGFPNDRNMFSPDNQNYNQNQFRGGNNNMMGPRGFKGQMNNSNMHNNRNMNPFSNKQSNANMYDDSNPGNDEVVDLDDEPEDINDGESVGSGGVDGDGDGDGNGNGDDGIPEKFTRPGCVVEMENVPYRSDLKDIIEFFDGYSVKAEDIIRRYNDDGTPTGDARVAFNSPEEAKSAYESKRQKSILNRTIFLNVL